MNNKAQIAQLQAMRKRATTAIDSIPGLEKVTADRVTFFDEQESVSFENATIYFDRANNTYLVNGDFQVENQQTIITRMFQQMTQQMAMDGAMKGQTHDETALREIDASEEGVNMEDVELLISQTSKSKEEVIVALKKASGDMIEALDYLQ